MTERTPARPRDIDPAVLDRLCALSDDAEKRVMEAQNGETVNLALRNFAVAALARLEHDPSLEAEVLRTEYRKAIEQIDADQTWREERHG